MERGRERGRGKEVTSKERSYNTQKRSREVNESGCANLVN
jgi:hypothetical protein